MAPLNDEQAGEILGKYVEALKNADDPSTVNFVAVTSAGTEELAPVMKTAALAAQALAEERSPDAAKEAARAKFRARAVAMAQQAAADRALAPRPVRAPGGWERLRRPGLVGGLGWACAVALAGFLVLSRPASVSRPAPGTPVVQAPQLSHSEVHAAVPRLVANRVPADRARALLAHLAWCDACFNVYRDELRRVQGGARSLGRAPGTGLAPSARSLASAAAAGPPEEFSLVRRN